MATEKKFLPKIKLYSPEDLSKKWFLYYYQDGRRIRVYGDINKETTAADRRKAAGELRQKLTDELLKGAQPRPVLPDFREKVYKLLEEKRGVWKKKSYQTFKSKWNRFFDWADGREICPELFREFFKWLARNRHKTTHNNYHNGLGVVLRELGRADLLEGVKKIRAHSTPAKYFQPHQIQRVKRVVAREDPELWFFIEFIFYCFIRPKELRNLKVGDVLLDDSRILLRPEVSKNGKHQYVTIPRPFLKSVERLRNRDAREYIFPGRYDSSKPASYNYFSRRHRKWMNELGFGLEYKLYSWKHTGAVMAIKAGIGVKELQLQLRHHSLDMVNKYLRQMGVEDMENLRERFPGI